MENPEVLGLRDFFVCGAGWIEKEQKENKSKVYKKLVDK